jgi:hypothetical protein
MGEDTLPRYITTISLIDSENGVIVGADKFGNIFASRITDSN